MATPQTDAEGNPIPQTEEVTPEVKPEVNPDENEGKPMTRKEKTAKKLGVTVEQLDEMRKIDKEDNPGDDRITKLEKQNEQILKALNPAIQKQEDEALLAEFQNAGVEGVEFDVFKSELDSALEMGADPEKAKAKILEKMKAKGQGNIETQRETDRNNADLPPASDATGTPAKFQLLARQQYETLLQDKGVTYYKEYNAFCEQYHGGKYFQ